MRQVPIKRLAPGMRVGKAVRAGGGVLLLKEGAALTDRNIWVLKSWGVPSVWVEGLPEESQEDQTDRGTPTDERGLEARVRERFEGLLDHPAMQEIMRATIQILRRREQNSKQVQG